MMFFAGIGRAVPVIFFVLLYMWDFSLQNGVEPAVSAAESPPPVASCDPAYENRLETDHFVLRWTNRSVHPEDNISNPAIVSETADYLEIAWARFTALFGRLPYMPAGNSKVMVVFKDLECYAFADPPEGPIEFNSSVWANMPSVRRTASAHELFHKFQYAYGYKTRWPPHEPVLWFTEGTAAWAEVCVWKKVSRNCKMEDMFKDPDLDLYEAEDMALPFWIYFVSGNRTTPRDRLMVRLFEKYEATGNAEDALRAVIREAYGSVDGFFSRFAAERRKGFWREPAGGRRPYASILGPDGKDLVEEIKHFQRSKNNAAVRTARAP